MDHERPLFSDQLDSGRIRSRFATAIQILRLEHHGHVRPTRQTSDPAIKLRLERY